MKSGNLDFLEPSGPLQTCNGTALPFYIFTFMIISRNKHSEYVTLSHGNNNYVIALQRCFIRTYVRTSPVLSKFVRAKFHKANRRKANTDCTRIFPSLEICLFVSVSETNDTTLKTVIALLWVNDTVLIRSLLP